MQKFNNELENEDLSIEFDFKMKIFGEDYFPKKLIVEIIELLPQKLKDSFLMFEDSFIKKNDGKRIVGISFNDSVVEMEAEFKSGKYILIMNSYQMCIMDLFNNKDEISVKEIQNLFISKQDFLKNFIE
jgi:hypothetical protein